MNQCLNYAAYIYTTRDWEKRGKQESKHNPWKKVAWPRYKWKKNRQKYELICFKVNTLKSSVVTKPTRVAIKTGPYPSQVPNPRPLLRDVIENNESDASLN